MYSAVESFLMNQGKSMIFAWLTGIVAVIFAKYPSIASLVSSQTLLSWGEAGAVSGLVAVIHLVDHNYNNGAPTASTPVPNAPVAAPAAPALPTNLPPPPAIL